MCARCVYFMFLEKAVLHEFLLLNNILVIGPINKFSHESDVKMSRKKINKGWKKIFFNVLPKLTCRPH